MFEAIKVAILCKVHYKGWCSGFHRPVGSAFDPDRPWSVGCPVADRVIFTLFPPIIVGDIRKIKMSDDLAKALLTPYSVIHCET